MADQPKDSFNNAARRKLMTAAAMALGIAGVQQDDIRSQFEVSLFAPNAGPFIKGVPELQKNTALNEPVQRPLVVEEIWSDRGLGGQKFKDAFATLSSEQKDRIASRSNDLFAEAGFTDVMQRMGEGKQKKLNEILEKIADMPPGMRLITTDYISIEPEQNKAVWREFQEKAEPAFYRYIAATQETALREAGFCDHAINCMRRGYGPTDKDGIHYNVDIDHLTERKGGGLMSTEKSVDPELGGAPMYAINHIANLCLIMRSVHTQTKNTINNLQDINAIAVGETRRIVMAVPEEGKERMMLHAQNIRADVQPPAETSYFALGPSLQITRELERMMRDNISVPPDQAQIFYEVQIADNFKHTIKLWTALAASLDRGVKDSSFKARDAKAVRENCDGFLIPLEKAMIAAHMPQDAVDSLRDIGNRIYANLDLVSQGESPVRNMPQKQEKHIDVRSG